MPPTHAHCRFRPLVNTDLKSFVLPQKWACEAAFWKLDWKPWVSESGSGTSGDLVAGYLVGRLTPVGGGYTATLCGSLGAYSTSLKDCSWELLPDGAQHELFAVWAATAAGSFPTILELFDRTVAEIFIF